MTNKKYSCIIVAMVCLLIGFICITFTSKNSFLFAFQDSRDIQIFLTTARGILNGDVLYRDIFEVKGPYLYLIYVLGLMISKETLMGVYLIEGLIFATYLFVSYKIANLYLKSVPLCLIIAAITGFLSTTTYAMDAGGQCEELLLPVFSVIIYVTLKYFKQIYPQRIPVKDVLLVSVCFTIIFWMKYTLVGLVLGLILYLIYLQIKDKTIQNIAYYAGIFLFGVILVTLPIIIYFTYHNSWDAFWDAYFHKLLFEYKPDSNKGFGLKVALIFQDYIAVSCFSAYAFIYSCIYMIRSPKARKHQNGSIAAMMLFQALGMSFSRNWKYTPECMHAFNALGITLFVLVLSQVIVFVRKNASTVAQKIEENKNCSNNVLVGIVAIVGVLLVINREAFLLPILLISILGMLLWCYFENWDSVEHNIESWKVEYREKRTKINVLLCALSVILFAFYVFSFSKTSYAIGIPLEKYPQYKIAQYILNSDVENPIIINYHTTDAGIYGLTNTKPPTKWVGDYNTGFDDVKTMYDEYIDVKKADFIIAESGDFELEGYRVVYYSGSTNYIHEGRTLEFYLYAREN